MDKHLNFLVRQTERYTNMLTENLRKGGMVGLQLGDKINFLLVASNDLQGSLTVRMTAI